ncbi:hypothetical protein [Chromobacterium violaceum]|uniref:hypothetical protein n=1 Tax=Chromobacterium violaceum TaxID=536 RepID=UPI001B33FCBD|nr:hypothetical protein [Chromobacterium violaceum]MBP4047406.1 hypothetical protein [Chromobacterium violaceum]
MTERQILHIAALIKEWTNSAPPTWKRIVTLVAQELHHQWSRQTLQSHPQIKQAYENKVAACRYQLKTGKQPPQHLPEHIVLEQKLEQLENENEELKARLHEYDELLLRYLGNAIRYGVTQEQLEQPLTPPPRQQTDPLLKNNPRKQKKGKKP